MYTMRHYLKGMLFLLAQGLQSLMDYVNQTESAKTFVIRVLRAGEQIELPWVSGDL